MNVIFEIIGDPDAPETGVQSNFEVPPTDMGEVVTVGELRQWFPYVGHYHFRAKTPWAGSHIWMDLTEDTSPVPVWDGEEGGYSTAVIRVLPLDYGDDAYGASMGGEDAEVYTMEMVDFSTPAPSGRAGVEMLRRPSSSEDDGLVGDDVMGAIKRQSATAMAEATRAAEQLREQANAALNSEAAQDIRRKTAQGAKAGMSMLKMAWKAAKKGVEDLQTQVSTGGGRPRPPSPMECAALATLAHDFQHGAGDADKAAARANPMLLDLWSLLVAGEPFRVEGQAWKKLGFVNPRPMEDLKASGVLGLRTMLHFAAVYPAKIQLILKEQAPRTDRHYPLAIVANNITLMVAEVLRLRFAGFADLEICGWGIFNVEGEAAAFEVFAEVVCLLIRLLDARWKRTGATRRRFGELIAGLRRDFESLMQEDPLDLQVPHPSLTLALTLTLTLNPNPKPSLAGPAALSHGSAAHVLRPRARA
mmetsp:Transcript_31540/g.100089  ORF Transcript_31540/g.100089 Transcript_31540/m.100089 type:complete len:474 (-) Transcript_31540:54-1475(-)